jgi:hypothetical protein
VRRQAPLTPTVTVGDDIEDGPAFTERDDGPAYAENNGSAEAFGDGPALAECVDGPADARRPRRLCTKMAVIAAVWARPFTFVFE